MYRLQVSYMPAPPSFPCIARTHTGWLPRPRLVAPSVVDLFFVITTQPHEALDIHANISPSPGAPGTLYLNIALPPSAVTAQASPGALPPLVAGPVHSLRYNTNEGPRNPLRAP